MKQGLGRSVDGEQILIYAGIAQIVGVAIVTLLVWTGRKGREEGVRASDLAALDKAIHRLANVVEGMPTGAALKLVDSELRREIEHVEASIMANVHAWRVEHLKESTAQATELALAVTNAAAAAAAAAALRVPQGSKG